MRKAPFALAILVLLVTSTSSPVAAGKPCDEPVRLDYIDIGDTGSEAGHKLKGWGPVEPATSGGNYGGIDDARVTWEPGARNTRRHRLASFVLRVPRRSMVTQLKLRVLDGLADDSLRSAREFEGGLQV